MNSTGQIFRLTTFGESHGPAMGGVIDGIPPCIIFNMQQLRTEIARRRPGQSHLTSSRRETDNVRFLSGLMTYNIETQRVTALTDESAIVISLGTPIGFTVENCDAHSKDYDTLRNIYRPSHADYTWQMRYGIRDWRGGGRTSGRETVSRVIAGAFAKQLLTLKGIEITSAIARLAGVDKPDKDTITKIIESARNSADSVGGVVECSIKGVPAGIGEPVFNKLDSLLAQAFMSIGGVKGVEFGMGFAGCDLHGSDVADEFAQVCNGEIITTTNNSGGIQGGISNGMEITARIAIKPTPTIARELNTVDSNGTPTTLKVTGRHDPSIVLRIRPVIEAMAAITLLDTMLVKGMNFPTATVSL